MSPFELAVVRGIRRIGAAKDDTYGYVECDIEGDGVLMIAFAEEMASGMASAFIAATSHVQRKAAERTGEKVFEVVPFPVDGFSIGTVAGGSGILSLELRSGGRLHFFASRSALAQLHERLGRMLSAG